MHRHMAGFTTHCAHFSVPGHCIRRAPACVHGCMGAWPVEGLQGASHSSQEAQLHRTGGCLWARRVCTTPGTVIGRAVATRSFIRSSTASSSLQHGMAWRSVCPAGLLRNALPRPIRPSHTHMCMWLAYHGLRPVLAGAALRLSLRYSGPAQPALRSCMQEWQLHACASAQCCACAAPPLSYLKASSLPAIQAIAFYVPCPLN